MAAARKAARRPRPKGRIGFVPMEINPEPAPISHITTEDGLPKRQRALVFWPHSDDGIYHGASLSFMNARMLGRPTRRNYMKLVIVSPGYRGVPGEGTKKEKSERRWTEAVAAGYLLGFDENQHMVNFNAVKTYEQRRIHKADQRRMDALVKREAPTLVMLPSTLDTEQRININTRKMVMASLRKWMAREYRAGRPKEISIMEYPTNHLPLLTPSGRNYMIDFTHRGYVDMKHTANRAHTSQEVEGKGRGLVQRSMMVEAQGKLMHGDELSQMRRISRKVERQLRGIKVDATSGRGEEFLLARLKVETRKGKPVIVHKRFRTPLSPTDRRKLGIDVPALNDRARTVGRWLCS